MAPEEPQPPETELILGWGGQAEDTLVLQSVFIPSFPEHSGTEEVPRGKTQCLWLLRQAGAGGPS